MIHEELYKTNLCKCIDAVNLNIDQWVNITRKIFIDQNPIEKVDKISKNPLVSINEDHLPGVKF